MPGGARLCDARARILAIKNTFGQSRYIHTRARAPCGHAHPALKIFSVYNYEENECSVEHMGVLLV